MADIMNTVAAGVWSLALIGLILLTGLYYTVRMGFPQIFQAKEMLRLLRVRGEAEGGLSPLQSFVFTAARTFGVGNIAGMSAGIYFGGPGAIFWLWVLAFFGSALAILEGTLAQTFKTVFSGGFRGGPARYMRCGMNNSRLGRVFALVYSLVTVVSLTFLMPGVQSYYIVQGATEAFGVHRMAAGVVLTMLLGLVIHGGIGRMGRTTLRISPLVGSLYVLVSVVVILANADEVPGAFALIFRSAFGSDAVFGGIFGYALQWGIRRGVLANEVAVGTSAILSATSSVSHPAQQGLLGGLSVYIGTLFVCTTTTLMILVTGSYNVAHPAGGFLFEGVPGVAYGNPYVSHAIQSVIPVPGFGQLFVALAIFFFAFVALTAFYLHAESNLSYLLGDRPGAFVLLRTGFLLSVFLGTLIAADTIWAMADIGFGTMAWINVTALIVTGNLGVRIYRDYVQKLRAGGLLAFDPRALDIRHGAEVWVKKCDAANRKEDHGYNASHSDHGVRL